MESNPSHFKGKDLPVERVDWFECKEFCKKTGFQLLSGADWEYACRGATTTEFCFGNEEKELKKYAWYVENSRFKTHQVGGKKPNGFGLYDMHGNVWEWCEDFYPYLFSSRICCGGCWNESAKYCRSAFREGSYPSDRNMALGVRVCRSV
jgi:formylglycine-generating enzyme required for sulfatase activity